MPGPPPLPACVPTAPKPPARPSGRLAANVLERYWFGDEDPNRTDEEASTSFAAALGRMLRLRAFPGVVAEALRLLSRQDSHSRDIALALERDPSVCARMLMLANSAVFGGLGKCGSVPEALVRLGNRKAGEVVLSVAALGMYEDTTGVATVFRDHVLGVAAISRSLALAWGGDQADNVFAAGLLTDIGKLFILSARDVDYESLDPSLLAEPEKTHVLERMWVGWDHAVLGAHLLEAWQLPDDLALSVALHHQPGRAYERGGQLGLSVALLRLADVIEYQLRKRPEADPEFIAQLARGGDASYASLSERNLCDLWPRFAKVRSDALGSVRVVSKRS
ncbi:MAG: HDOD domain-containing protein [Polyangiaceae bacterium]